MFSRTPSFPTIPPGIYTLIKLVTAIGAQVTIGAAVPEPGSVGLGLLDLLRRRTRK